MKQFFPRFLRHQKGAAFIEFAIVFPFMFLLLFAGVEIARYILIIQRVEKAVYVLTDIVGQESPALEPSQTGEITVSEIQDNVFPQFTRLMGVFGNVNNQAVIMSSVINTSSSGLRMRWQQSSPVGSNVGAIKSVVTGLGPQNTVGDACSPAPFDGTITPLFNTMTAGENMIVGEVFFRYSPIVGNLLSVSAATPRFTGGGFGWRPETIGRRAFLHPRNGELIDLPPSHKVKLNAQGNQDIFPCGK